jgi:Peptidase family M50
MSDSTSPLSTANTFEKPVEVFILRPPRRRYWLHLLLLLGTVLTTLVVGAGMQYDFNQNRSVGLFDTQGSNPIFPIEWVLEQPQRLKLGIPFSFSLMLILLCHEMGHFLFCLYYRVWATLPYFLPMPFISPIGTVGAFIRIRGPIRSRSALFDIGVAGPIAGFVVACVAMVVGLKLSRPLPANVGPAAIQLGYPLIFKITNWLLGIGTMGSQVTLARTEFHPVAVAAWVGMFATALNLLPGGQLDGGHIVYAMAPRKHRWVSILTALVLIPMAVYLWLGWLIWAVFLLLTGLFHPRIPEFPPPGRGRRFVLGLAALMLILCFTPAPFHLSLRDAAAMFRAGR